MKLLGSTKNNNKIINKITKDTKSENLFHSEITEVVLVPCNIVNTDYKQDSRVLYIFIPDKSFGQLLDISPKNVIFLKSFNSEFAYIEVWSTDQNSKLQDIKYLQKTMDFCLLLKIWTKILAKI